MKHDTLKSKIDYYNLIYDLNIDEIFIKKLDIYKNEILSSISNGNYENILHILKRAFTVRNLIKPFKLGYTTVYKNFQKLDNKTVNKVAFTHSFKRKLSYLCSVFYVIYHE